MMTEQSDNLSVVDSLPETMGREKVVFGFDGYIDRVREIVDERRDQESYQRVRRLSDFGEQVSEAAKEERSILMEWVCSDVHTGGHVCHLSRALGLLGYSPKMIGMFGRPIKDPFQEEFSSSEMVSLGKPAHTDAIECNDGNCMLTESGGMRELDWETITEEVGFDRLASYLDGAAVFGMGYWAEIPNMISIFEGLIEELAPTLSSPPEHILIDPADIGKRPPGEIKRGGDALRRLDEISPVTMSANRFETNAIANSLLPTDTERSLLKAATVAREQLGITRFVAHGARESALSADSELVTVDVPYTNKPDRRTGAGDYFNAGLVLGLVHGLEPSETVVLGNAVAGCYVRQGNPPSYQQIQGFLNSYTVKTWKSGE